MIINQISLIIESVEKSEDPRKPEYVRLYVRLPERDHPGLTWFDVPRTAGAKLLPGSPITIKLEVPDEV